MKHLLHIAALGAAFCLVGCADLGAFAGNGAGAYAQARNSAFIHSSRQAIAQMLQEFPVHTLNDSPVLVATLVNVNHLAHTSALGRTLSEVYASQLANAGLNVKELKLRGDVYVKEGSGELLLSREIRHIAHQHSAGFVLVGTYSQAKSLTYISLKLVRTTDSRIMRSYDYAIPNDADVQRLLTTTEVF